MIPTPSFSVIRIALNWHTIMLDHLTKAFAKNNNPKWIDYQRPLDFHSSRLLQLNLKINKIISNNIQAITVGGEVLALQHRIVKLRNLIKGYCIDNLQDRLNRLVQQGTAISDEALFSQYGKFQIQIGSVEKEIHHNLHSPGELAKLEEMKAIFLKFVMQINSRLERFNISFSARDHFNTTIQGCRSSPLSLPGQQATLIYANALIDDVTDTMVTNPPVLSLKCLFKIHSLLSRYEFRDPYLDNLARTYTRIETLQDMLESYAIGLCKSGLDDAFKQQQLLISDPRPSPVFFQQMTCDLGYLSKSNNVALSRITSLQKQLESLQKGVESAQTTNAEAFNFIPKLENPTHRKPQGKATCTSKKKWRKCIPVQPLPPPSTVSRLVKPPVTDAPPLTKPTVVQICVPLHPAVPPTQPSSSITEELERVWIATHQLEALITYSSIDPILDALRHHTDLQQIVFFHMHNKALSIQQRVLMHASYQDSQMSLDTVKRSLNQTHKELICLSFMLTVQLKGVHLAQKKFKQYFIRMNLWETYEENRYSLAEKMSLNIAAIEAMKCVLQFLQVEFGYRKG